MRPINVSLDSTTWEMAKNKKNFSEWIRKQLHLDYNHKQLKLDLQFETDRAERMSQLLHDIRKGKKHWVETSGWVSCDVEVIEHDHNQELEE